MDAAQDGSPQEQENLAGDVMDSLGVENADGEANESHASDGMSETTDPLYVQKRLKQQKRAHDRELRAMRAEMMQHMQTGSQPNTQNEPMTSPYENSEAGDIAGHIHKAVSHVFQQKELAERKAREAEQRSHIEKQYENLHKHLDDVSDKYEDFDDVVRSNHAPFTETMRDAALMLPQKGPGSAGEVLYKLGKNPEKLAEISKLHPLEQARELTGLSHALAAGAENKSQSLSRPMGSIKSNPVVNSAGITDKTPVSDLRARMKEGKFK